MDLRNYLSKTNNPHKLLKTVVAISVVLMLIWLIVVSRMDFGQPVTHSDPAVQEQADSIRSMVEQRRGDSQAVSPERDRGSGVFMNAMTTFLIMATILGIVWFWVRKKTDMPESKQFHELGEHSIDIDKKIKMLEINREVWVLSVTSDNITLLHRYPKEEWKEELPQQKTEESSFYKMFRGHHDS